MGSTFCSLQEGGTIFMSLLFFMLLWVSFNSVVENPNSKAVSTTFRSEPRSLSPLSLISLCSVFFCFVLFLSFFFELVYPVLLISPNDEWFSLGLERDLWIIIEYCEHGNLLEFLRKRRDIFTATWTAPTEHADVTFTTIDLYICALQVARAMEFLASRRVRKMWRFRIFVLW